MVNDDVIMEDSIELQDDDEGLNLDDFGGGSFVNNPSVGSTTVFKVLKVYNNVNTKGKNNSTGKEFDIGLKQKDGKVRRIDIDTDMGVYTIKNWEIFFKLLDTKVAEDGEPKGILARYAKAHGKSFVGAKVSITRLIEGGHANYKIDDLAKIIGKSIPETKVYQESVKLAIKESRLFVIKLEE